MTTRPDYDVAVVGGSLAGSSTAIHLARAGARVALIERKPEPSAYKRVCGHFIQPSALPALERLGLLPALEDAGAFRGYGQVWTRHGWVRRGAESGLPQSLSIRRSVLDPLLRRIAAETPGVDLLAGHTAESLERSGGVSRLGLRAGADGRSELTARLVVGADGRGSRTAKLAGLDEKRSTNLRFGYCGYFDGPPLPGNPSVQLWFLEPDVALATPTDGGLVLYVAMPHRDRIPEFKADPEGALRRFIERLPDAPPIAESTLVGSMFGKLDLTNEARPAAGDGIALVGDAALTQDPVAAIGCGWALQSAEWLADAAAPALAGDAPLAPALEAYARRHRKELGGHARLLDGFAASEKLNPIQNLLFSAGTRDPHVARRLGMLAGRLDRPTRILTPALLARAAFVNARARRAPGAPAQAQSVQAA